MAKIILPKADQEGPNEWQDVEDNDVAIREVVNGELDNDNIKAGANISGSKLADSSTPLSKLDKHVVEAPSAVRVVYGRVAANGGFVGGSNNFKVTKEGTGVYRVTYTGSELGASVTPVATPAGEEGNNFIRIDSVSEGNFLVRIFDASLNGEDRDFTFIVIG